MKQLLLLPFLLLTAQLAFTQQSALHQFIDEHQNDPAFTYAYLSKDLFEHTIQADIEQKDWQKLHQVVKNLGSLRILVSDSVENAMPLFKDALGRVEQDQLDELLSVQDGEDRVRLWVREADGILTDLVLLVGAHRDFVLVCFSGNLALDNILGLADMFQAADARALAQSANATAFKFNVFPNPSNGALTLQYDDSAERAEQLAVFDANGRLVKTITLDGSPTQPMHVRELEEGVYWFQLKTQSGKVGIQQVQIKR